MRRHRRIRILYAGNNRSVAQAFRRVMTAAGYFAAYTCSGRIALSRLQDSSDRFHLLITVSRLSDFSGPELIRQARQMGFRGKIILEGWRLSKHGATMLRSLRVDAVTKGRLKVRSLAAMVDVIMAF